MAARIEPAFVGLSKPEEDFLSERSWLWKNFAVKECRYELHREHAFSKLDRKTIDLEKESRHVFSLLYDYF